MDSGGFKCSSVIEKHGRVKDHAISLVISAKMSIRWKLLVLNINCGSILCQGT